MLEPPADDPYDLTFFDEVEPAWGMVLDEGRGSLPFALVHGESLVACAAWALGQAGVRAADLGTAWGDIVEAGVPLVLHDSLCPMTPADFIADCLDRAVRTGRVVVAVRAVTDTVKRVGPPVDLTGSGSDWSGSGGVESGAGDSAGPASIGATLDRTTLLTLASPIVLPAAVVAALDGPPGADPDALLAGLADWQERFGVDQVAAPSAARRVASRADVRVLQASTQPV